MNHFRNIVSNIQTLTPLQIGTDNSCDDISGITIGQNTSQTNQSINAISIGVKAGHSEQGSFSVALGFKAGFSEQHDHCVVINSTGEALDTQHPASFYVAPIRKNFAFNTLYYNTDNNEITCLPNPPPSCEEGLYHSDHLHWDSDNWKPQQTTRALSIGPIRQTETSFSLRSQESESEHMYLGKSLSIDNEKISLGSQLNISEQINIGSLKIGHSTTLECIGASSSPGCSLNFNPESKEIFFDSSGTNVVRPFDQNIRSVLQLNPKTFFYDSDPQSGQQIGFVADEVSLLNPYFAKYDSHGSPIDIHYDTILVFMLENLKKQRERINGIQMMN